MSDAQRRLRDGLESGPGARVAAGLSEAGAAGSVVARARRAKSVRIAWQAGTAAAVAVVVAGAAVIWWGPTGAFEPVSPDPSASATTTLSSADAQVGDVAWLSGTEWACGGAFPLSEGVTVSDEAARKAGEVTTVLTDGFGEPGVTEVGGDSSWDASWYVTIADSDPDLASISTRSVVTLNGRIVGVGDVDENYVSGGPASPASGSYVDLDAGSLEVLVAQPGECGLQSYLWDDGTFEAHLVVQLVMADGSIAQLVDPGGAPSILFSDMRERMELLLVPPAELDALTPPQAWSQPVEKIAVDSETPSAEAVMKTEGQPGFVCGEEWDLDDGVWLNEASYAESGVSVTAALIDVTGDSDLPLSEGAPAAELLSWRVDVSPGTDDEWTDTWAQSVAVRDGVIVGASEVSADALSDSDGVWVDIPLSGSCRSQVADQWASTTDEELARTEMHLVVIRVDAGDTYATWVDPGGTLTEAEAIAR